MWVRVLLGCAMRREGDEGLKPWDLLLGLGSGRGVGVCA